MFKVKFADIGEGLTEGKVQEVFVKVGDNVKMGDSLFNVETDKVNSDIPAPVDGKIAKILIKKDQEIKVGEVVVEIDDGSASKSISEPEQKGEVSAKVEPISVPQPVKTNVEQPLTTTNLQQNSIKATPLARKIAAKMNVDLNLVSPTGPHGRILLEDVQNFSSKPQSISITVEKLSSNIDYNQPKITVPQINQPLTFTNKPMNTIRKATVKAMQKSHAEIAGFTGFRSIQVSELVSLRKQLKAYAESMNIKLTYLAFIIKAVALTLKQMPNLNVRIDKENNNIAFADQVNIGMACDTPEGLLVPVIKGADQLSVLQIAVKINDLATKAKTKNLAINEMMGATFTITNFGTVELEYATPIINFPEGAILGVGMMETKPVYLDGNFEPREFMPFSITADHRIIDGADAGRFLQKVAEYLKNPALLLL